MHLAHLQIKTVAPSILIEITINHTSTSEHNPPELKKRGIKKPEKTGPSLFSADLLRQKKHRGPRTPGADDPVRVAIGTPQGTAFGGAG